MRVYGSDTCVQCACCVRQQLTCCIMIVLVLWFVLLSCDGASLVTDN